MDLLARIRRLRDLHEADDWEEAVEAILLKMAERLTKSEMLQADYTRKTQELADLRRALAKTSEAAQ